MSFLFGGKKKQIEEKEETQGAKYLRARLQKMAEENQTLRDRLDDQKTTAACNKKLLGNF